MVGCKGEIKAGTSGLKEALNFDLKDREELNGVGYFTGCELKWVRSGGFSGSG